LELSGCGVERASLLVFLRLKTWGAERYFRPDLKPGGGAIAPAAPPSPTPMALTHWPIASQA